MLFQAKQLLSGSWLLDGLTMFFVISFVYLWGRWIVVHLLYETSWAYENVKDEWWDHEGKFKAKRTMVTWLTILLLCIEAAAYIVRQDGYKNLGGEEKEFEL